MASAVTSIYNNIISAASAGFAPTNSADVSAIASSYQVVSATATQLYAGTSYVTSVNEAPISASRAGNAANASLANSAWYDGTGRLISSLPDSAAVSAIASSYAESAASSKLDESATADFYSTSNPSGFITGVDLSDYQPTSAMTAYQVSGDYAYNSSLSSKLDTSASSSFYGSDNPSGFITGVDLSDYATTAYVDSSVSSKQDTLTFGYDGANISSIDGSALAGGGGGGVDSATVSAIASSYAESAVSSKQDTLTFGYDGSNNISSIDGSALAGGGGGLVYGATAAYNSNKLGLGASGTGTKTDAGLYLSSTHGTGFYKVNEMTLNRSSYGETVKFNLGSAGSQVILSAYGTRGAFHSAWNSNASASFGVSGDSAYLKLGDCTAYEGSIAVWDSTYITVASNSASWGGGGGVDSATVSAIASSYVMDVSADVSGTVDLVSSQSANWGGSALALSAGPGISLTKSGNVLVAGLDETVLWSGTLNTLNSNIECSENLSNFSTVKVFYRLVADSVVQSVGVHEFEPSEMSNNNVSFGGFYLLSNNYYGWWLGRFAVTDGYKVKITNTRNSWGTGNSPSDGTQNQDTVGFVYKIVGINRKAEA